MSDDFLDGVNLDDLTEDEFEECYECGGEGFVLRDCDEDTCCCAEPEASHGFKICPMCGGE